MGQVNCLYTWRSANGNTMPFRLDRFICSIMLAEHFLLADVRWLSRQLFDHTPIVRTENEGQRQSSYFKVDRSWVREVSFKEEVEREWSSQVSLGSKTKRLADKIIGLQRRLIESLESALET